MISLTSTSVAQDTDKQKIATVIMEELLSFSNKDRKTWESYWVHGDALKRFTIAADYYNEILGWDSLNHAADAYFKTNAEGYKANKTILDIRVEGNIAIAHVSEDHTNGMIQEILILERKGIDWKLLEAYFLHKSTFENNDANTEASLNTQGYNLLRKKRIDDAIKVFKMNAELFPTAFNTWDSLAEAYMVSGNKEKAIECYQKSLDLNPKNDNAKKWLTSLKGESLANTPSKN
jgi:tetratricopeptide (TPR) repeat protein